MAIKRRDKIFYIDNKRYYIVLDMNTIIEFKENTGLNFLKTIENMKYNVDDEEIMTLCSYMLRKRRDSEPLGLEYFESFNPNFFIQNIINFSEIINSSLPSDGEVKDDNNFKNLKSEEIEDFDIDWYYYMSRDILHMSEEEFLNSTPAKIYDLLKLYNKLNEEEKAKLDKKGNKNQNNEVVMKALPNTI